jgi:lipopolysaccharide export system protein LptC
MKHREVIWFLSVFLGLLGLAAGLYFMARPPERRGSLKPALQEGVFVAMEGPTRITSSKDDRIAWTLSSLGLSFYRDRGQADVHSPVALIPLRDGGTVEVSGALGFYSQASEDISLHGLVRVRQTREGKLNWALAGSDAYYRHAAEVFDLDEISGTLYPENGETVGIEGGEGKYYIKTRTMSLDRDVRCRFKDGITLMTDHLTYDVGTETASTASAVAITGQGFDMKSLGLSANLKTRMVVAPAMVNVRLSKGMKGKK